MRDASLATFLITFAAGAVSFISPCFLPLVPGYIAFISGGEANDRMLRVGLFVSGFTLIFVLLGFGSGAVGGFLLENRRTLEIVAGVLITVFGALMVLPRLPWWLEREHRMELKPPTGRFAAVGLGAAFAIGWSPCIGPALATALTFAATSGDAVTGGAMLFVFSLGLGLPLLLVALLADRVAPGMGGLTKQSRKFQIGAGSLLIAFGVLMATGVIGNWSARLSGTSPFGL